MVLSILAAVRSRRLSSSLPAVLVMYPNHVLGLSTHRTEEPSLAESLIAPKLGRTVGNSEVKEPGQYYNFIRDLGKVIKTLRKGGKGEKHWREVNKMDGQSILFFMKAAARSVVEKKKLESIERIFDNFAGARATYRARELLEAAAGRGPVQFSPEAFNALFQSCVDPQAVFEVEREGMRYWVKMLTEGHGPATVISSPGILDSFPEYKKHMTWQRKPAK